MSADGRDARTIVAQPEGAQSIAGSFGVAWSPDGTRLAFVELGPTVVIADVTTRAVVRIPHAHSPSWSPDARRLVYEDAELADTHLVVADADGSDRRRIVTLSEGGGDA